MTRLSLVLKHLRNRKIRTASTIVAMAACVFFLYTLQMLQQAMATSIESASATRLATRHTASVIFLLPLTYGDKIAAVPGVRRVAAMNWFGGIYRDPKNFFPTGLIGCALALPANALSAASGATAGFAELTWAFRVTPSALAGGLAFAVVQGFLGGLLPAIGASRMAIAAALRES